MRLVYQFRHNPLLKKLQSEALLLVKEKFLIFCFYCNTWEATSRTSWKNKEFLWRISDLNWWLHLCKRCALPTELIPHSTASLEASLWSSQKKKTTEITNSFSTTSNGVCFYVFNSKTYIGCFTHKPLSFNKGTCFVKEGVN